MNCDLLLYWMTHTGEGTWAGFRKAISELTDSADQKSLARQLRVILSDLGHVDFFIDGSQRWRALPPMLAGLAVDDSVAVLCGSRTPDLIRLVKGASDALGCQVTETLSEDGPTLIAVRGAAFDIGRVAEHVQISFLPKASSQLLSAVDPIASQIERAVRDQQPFNWDAESFDLSTLAWVDGVQPNAACKFTPRYGSPRYLLHRKHRTFLQMPKRDAVYASASICGVSLLAYDAGAGVLTAPLAAPIPEKLARIACLCSGVQPSINRRALAYGGVPFDIASAVFVVAGQSHPGLQGLAETRRLCVG